MPLPIGLQSIGRDVVAICGRINVASAPSCTEFGAPMVLPTLGRNDTDTSLVDVYEDLCDTFGLDLSTSSRVHFEVSN